MSLDLDQKVDQDLVEVTTNFGTLLLFIRTSEQEINEQLYNDLTFTTITLSSL